MIVLIAAMMLVQQPIVVEADKPAQAAAKKKAKESCHNVWVSGSRMPMRVCDGDNANSDLGPNTTDASANPGLFHATPGPAQGGLGGVPK